MSYSIWVNKVSKVYRIYDRPLDRLLDMLPAFNRPHQLMPAVNEVSLTVQQGETVGIVGKNGSGKSTLLQMICGVLTPTSGDLRVSGRVGALLELGSGFNPEFSGLENVKLNAALVGMGNYECEKKLDKILEFADIGNYVNRPIKEYSSGMMMRLAFAVQAHIDPAVLVVDEALAVGDEYFQKKCFKRLDELKARGTSILLVSHSCAQINTHCDRAYLMHMGSVICEGDAHTITTRYQRLLQETNQNWHQILQQEHKDHLLTNLGNQQALPKSQAQYPKLPDSYTSYPKKGGEIRNLKILNHKNEITGRFKFGETIRMQIEVLSSKGVKKARIGLFIASKDGCRVAGVPYPLRADQYFLLNEMCQVKTFDCSGVLYPGVYFVGVGLTDISSSGEFIHRVIDMASFEVYSDVNIVAVGQVMGGTIKITEPQEPV